MGLHLHPDAVLAGAREFVWEHYRVAFIWQAADNLEVWFGAAGSFALHETLLEWMNVGEDSPFLLFNHSVPLHSEIRLQDGGSSVGFQKSKTERGFVTGDKRTSGVPLQC